MTPIEKREDILRLAIDIVCADRNNQYGEPEDNFSIIGELWGAYLTARCASTGVTVKIGAQEAADMLILFKVARSATATTPKLDTYVDIAGYAACAGAIIDKAVPSTTPLNIENEPTRTELFCRACQWSINHKCGHIETCDRRCPMYNEQVGKCKCLTVKTGDPCPYFKKWDGEQEKNNE